LILVVIVVGLGKTAGYSPFNPLDLRGFLALVRAVVTTVVTIAVTTVVAIAVTTVNQNRC